MFPVSVLCVQVSGDSPIAEEQGPFTAYSGTLITEDVSDCFGE